MTSVELIELLGGPSRRNRPMASNRSKLPPTASRSRWQPLALRASGGGGEALPNRGSRHGRQAHRWVRCHLFDTEKLTEKHGTPAGRLDLGGAGALDHQRGQPQHAGRVHARIQLPPDQRLAGLGHAVKGSEQAVDGSLPSRQEVSRVVSRSTK